MYVGAETQGVAILGADCAASMNSGAATGSMADAEGGGAEGATIKGSDARGRSNVQAPQKE